ncbi:hypothetical protein [Cellulosimicrobium protaetiae]|uniref:DUF7832 domain-containing protein n=1 Tax=Cellulosimicrobium protaetiae TaxID=2587808 RepID=A0A6M5UL20_9MICO|nr:hypothetical protein [Cellulosimicrobium protaetiae]QJW37941.1 hypothetical protein FIC82_018960 [Cellulosimicrobium protaetiae]
MTTKYDDASWHDGGEGYPPEAGPEAGATHIGMFLAWAVLGGHASEDLADDAATEVAALRDRVTTPGAFVREVCDGKLVDEDLDDVAAAFASAYYAGDEDDGGLYLEDYVDAVSPGDGEPEDVYRVPDTWETYELVGPLVDARFSQWEDEGRPAVLRHRA